MEDDTIKLLRECNAGIKMGVLSIDDVLDKVQDDGLKELLNKSKASHTKLGNKTHEYLNEYHDDGKEPAMMAKLMSKMKTAVMVDSINADVEIADIMTDGCNMGIKSLYQYLNQYPAADDKIKKLAIDVADVEEQLMRDLRAYL